MAWIRACGGGSPAVPDGKTVTPINDVTIWQQCAGIANPTYTTLAEVLADVGILSALMASNNAVDYLVRCKAWIEKSVPIMTSNTTPSGECFGQNTYSGDTNYWVAFDNNDNTNISTNASGTLLTTRIGYHFTEPIILTNASMVYYDDYESASQSCMHNPVIKGSNDGSSYATLTNILQLAKQTKTKSDFTVLQNGNSYSYICFECQSKIYGAIYSLEFKQCICNIQEFMTYIGANNYCADTLLADSDWSKAIGNSLYVDSVITAKVPIMMSDTTPEGVVSYSTQDSNSGYKGFNGFDGQITTGWLPGTDTFGVCYLQYAFPSEKDIYIVKVNQRLSATGSTVWKMQKSTDGVTFTDVDTITAGADAYSSWKTKAIGKHTGRYFRMVFMSSSNPIINAGSGFNFQFYGREDV